MDSAGRFFSLARSSAFSWLLRMPSMRVSTSRTLVRYSSSFCWSVELMWRLSASAFVADAIEDAQVAKAPAILEQRVERQRRIDFVRHRRLGILPRDVR